MAYVLQYEFSLLHCYQITEGILRHMIQWIDK